MTDFSMLILVAIIGYGLGSIPFGYIFARIGGHGDIRDIGSGNIGATNVMRTGNKFLALLTLLADGVKAFAAIMLANMLVGQSGMWLAAVAVIIGHLFPVWLNFKGGKGVAAFLGAMLALSPLTGIFALIVWTLSALISRKSSLAALITLVLVLPVLYILGEYTTAYISILMSVAIIWAHRANIARLRDGTEPSINA